MNNTIYIRVLQHDKNDQIRIGEAFPATDLNKAEKDIIAQSKQSALGAVVLKLLVRNITNVLLLFVRTRWK